MGRNQKLKKTGELQDGIIYKVFRKSEPNRIYIGSSFYKKEHRLHQHVSDFKRYSNGKGRYISSFEIVKFPDCDIDVIENVKVKSKEELDVFEDANIIKFKNDTNFSVVNKNRACRSKKQYVEDNKDEIREKANQKHQCACGGCFTHSHKARHEKSKQHITYNITIKTANITINN